MEDDRILSQAKLDKNDYLIAISCGVLAGLVDVFCVGAPGKSLLQGATDQAADGLVKKAAQVFYNFDPREHGVPRHCPETLHKCISYLEQAFPVPYDARYAKDLVVEDGVLEGMWPGNHHLLSLSHSPDPIGLIFSIIDQFTDMGSFVDQGKLIRVSPKKSSGAIPYLQGSNLLSRLFCGFVNWIGHIFSDISGSSSTRAPGKLGRGTGIAMPFYELLLFCHFGKDDGQTIADIAIDAFERDYDARFGACQAIPVILQDLFTRFIWSLKKHFCAQQAWKECIPTHRHADLRAMLLIGNACLCLIDGSDALIRAGLFSGFNPVVFLCRLNLVAWGKLTFMAGREVIIRIMDKRKQAKLALSSQKGQESAPSEQEGQANALLEEVDAP